MNYLIAIIPVLVFLLILKAMDSFKLVRFRHVAASLAAGFVAAIAAFFITTELMPATGLEFIHYSRYVAPVVEETLKSAWIVWLLTRRRTGFMVDTAIHGFAVGAGFAIIENVYYLNTMTGYGIAFSVVRGFGPALMHGTSTAIFGVLAKTASELRGSVSATTAFPAFLMAVLIHSLFNHFFVSPRFSALALLIGVPLVMTLVFRQSERTLRRWLGIGFDSDQQMLEMITSGDIGNTPVGEYLISLKRTFSGEIVADMLCCLRLHLELSIRAKGILLMRENGFEPPPDPDVEDMFSELKYLEGRIGVTGKLALHPLLRWSSRDLWQLHMLSGFMPGKRL
ncbi:MAG: PrsW family intramembrane metalloprotease [Candidatus Krumholzibacteria bacterium]|nr:PrsW family intramembrane metalloprotease [Candidatus Krumholzibacteria bacterium]